MTESLNSDGGWIAVNKGRGITSFDVVRKVRRFFYPLKVGHGGTLDSLATGVLPIAIGEATKTISYVMDCVKTYRFDVCWGESRTTDDPEGEVSERSDVYPTEDEILSILPQFTGEILQKPPLYSAIKVQGRRASDRARANEAVELSERRIQIHSLKLLKVVDLTRAHFEVVCGKGTYVRSLARDMASILGTVAYADNIHRAQVGFFTEARAILQEKLAMEGQKELLQEGVYPIELVLDDISAIQMDAQSEERLSQGGAIVASDGRLVRGLLKEGEIVLCLGADSRALALGVMKQGKIHPRRVFNIRRK